MLNEPEGRVARQSLMARVRWGASRGATLGVILTAVAIVGVLVTRGRSLQAVGMGLPLVAALYVLGCAVGGVIVGAMLPLARRISGLILLCILGVLPFMAMTIFAGSGLRWDSDASIALAIAAPVFGATMALVWIATRGLPK